MQRPAGVMGLIGIACAAFSCESTDAGKDGDDGARGNIVLLDEHNYRTTSSLTLPTVETASGTDLDICWDKVEKDIQCHGVAAQEDLDTVALLRFLHLSKKEVEAKLTSGQLDQSEIDGYLEYLTDHEATCAPLSAMTFFETPIDIEEEYVESDDHVYLLLFAEGTTPGVGARVMMFLNPTSNSTNTEVSAESGCGALEFSADLSDVTKVEVPADGPWVIDWRDITEDGQGNEIVFEAIDGVLIGFYEGVTVAELEAQILDLELIATSLWEIELDGGRTADLADARGRDGAGRFPGFDRDKEGVWMLGLMCSTCQNPSPLLLAVIEPTVGKD
ncbi:MAG TPA: hypothetical protein VK509_20180 [Polyangiales bacterium]|nr:hypothetical protein [Polyangiales bacterium]